MDNTIKPIFGLWNLPNDIISRVTNSAHTICESHSVTNFVQSSNGDQGIANIRGEQNFEKMLKLRHIQAIREFYDHVTNCGSI